MYCSSTTAITTTESLRFFLLRIFYCFTYPCRIFSRLFCNISFAKNVIAISVMWFNVHEKQTAKNVSSLKNVARMSLTNLSIRWDLFLHVLYVYSLMGKWLFSTRADIFTHYKPFLIAFNFQFRNVSIRPARSVFRNKLLKFRLH